MDKRSSQQYAAQCLYLYYLRFTSLVNNKESSSL